MARRLISACGFLGLASCSSAPPPAVGVDAGNEAAQDALADQTGADTSSICAEARPGTITGPFTCGSTTCPAGSYCDLGYSPSGRDAAPGSAVCGTIPVECTSALSPCACVACLGTDGTGTYCLCVNDDGAGNFSVVCHS